MSVLIVTEHSRGVWNRLCWETLAAARQIGAELGFPLSAAVLGREIGQLASEVATRSLARVYAVEHELLEPYTADAYTAALEALIRRVQPSLVLFPHTYHVRDFAPKLATRFNTVLVSDVVCCRFDGGSLFLVRQLFQGKLSADVRFAGPAPHFASIQAGAWREDQARERAAEIEVFAPPLDASVVRTRPQEPFQDSAPTVDLSSADAIVAVGRGMKDKDHLAMLEDLARALGAELGASRPACDAGWLPMDRQIGSSGQSVAPRLYVAVGVSGAIQHLVGMRGSKVVVAINKDPGAPIFEVADYGIAGDLFEVVPALIEEIRKAKA